MGEVQQSGLDFGANYLHETSFGDFTFNASFSKVLHLEKSVVAGGPLFDALDTYGFQVSERGRFNVNYRRGGLSANLSANYVGSCAAEAPCFPANSRILVAWFPQGERARAQSVYSVGMYFGIAFLGPVLFWVTGTCAGEPCSSSPG